MIAIKPLIMTVFIITTIVRGDEQTCDGDFTQNDRWCYKLMETVDDFITADQNCRKKGGNLVSIHSSEENAFITAFAVDQYIGLHYDAEAKNYSWTDGTPLDMKNWDAGYPMDPDYFGDCVIMQKSGKWINSECKRKFHHVCKKSISSDQCPAPPNNQLFNDGEVSSPEYPGNYMSGLSCSYMLIVRNDNRVQFIMTVNEMGIGDVIEIFSGLVANNDSRIGVINGSSGLKAFTTPDTENKMLIKFSSKSIGLWKFVFHSSKSCENGWIYGGDSGLNYCYKTIKENVIFEVAKEICEDKGAQLISIHNAFQNKFIVEKASEHNAVWLGLVYVNGFWKWTDESDVLYTNWASGEPKLSDGTCAEMSSSGKWMTANCESRDRYTVCYKPSALRTNIVTNERF